MAQLRFMAVHEDGQHLVLLAADGEELLLPIDERLRAAVRTRGPVPEAPPSQLRPRDVQAMIRAGHTAEEVAAVTGWPVERVVRFEAPIVAERGHVAGLARAAHVRGRGEGGVPTLESRVHGRLDARGVDLEAVTWDATRPEGGTWTVLVSFVAGQRGRSAAWRFEPADRTVEALDDEARWLSEDEQALPGSAAGKELLGTHGVTEEVDLVTSLRERSRTRGRRRRAHVGPSLTGEAVPGELGTEDVLPLEDLPDPSVSDKDTTPGGMEAADADESQTTPGAPEPDAGDNGSATEATEVQAPGARPDDDAAAGAEPPGAETPGAETPGATSARSRRRRAAKKRSAAKESSPPAAGGAATPDGSSSPAPPTEEASYDVELDFDEDYQVDPTPQDATLADLFGPGDDGRYPHLLDDDLDTSGFDGADETPDETSLNPDHTEGPGAGPADDEVTAEEVTTEAAPAADEGETGAASSDPDESDDTALDEDEVTTTDAPDASAGQDEAASARPAERSTRRRDGRPGVPSWDDIMFGAKDRK